MKGRNVSSQLAVIAALAVLVAVPALAAPHSLATVHAGASSVEWQPAVSGVGMVLTVSGPQGFYLRQEFKPGESATFSVFDKAGQIRPDGAYSWELTPVVHLDPATARGLEVARKSGEPDVGQTLAEEAGKLPAVPKLQSGSFTIADQAILAGGETEPGAGKPAASGNRLSAKDQVIADDLIVQQSLCVGVDCVNNENFGFDTIRLKENNLRIKFEDTSVGSFPTQDWQLTANDSASGGANKFSIDEISPTSATPFTIEGGAPTNALYVDDGGRVGLGTSTPVVELHIKDGDTPTVRLEQDSSSGFTSQTWDVAGNETNFFVRDVTFGSKLPFRIVPGAPTNSLFIANSGDVGMGTNNPSEALDVKRTDASPTSFVVENTNASPQVVSMVLDNTASDLGSWEFRVGSNGNLFINDTDSTGQVIRFVASTGEVQVPGDLTVDGVFSNPSSRTLKEGFEPVDTREVLSKVMDLPMSTWIYKKDVKHRRHLGPIAEDFQATFGLGTDANGKHIYPIDVQGVTMAAVQGLQHELTDVVAKKDQQIQDLQQRLADLEKLVDQLSQKE